MVVMVVVNVELLDGEKKVHRSFQAWLHGVCTFAILSSSQLLSARLDFYKLLVLKSAHL